MNRVFGDLRTWWNKFKAVGRPNTALYSEFTVWQRDSAGQVLPTSGNDEFRPFVRKLPEFKFWYSLTQGAEPGRGVPWMGCLREWMRWGWGRGWVG